MTIDVTSPTTQATINLEQFAARVQPRNYLLLGLLASTAAITASMILINRISTVMPQGRGVVLTMVSIIICLACIPVILATVRCFKTVSRFHKECEAGGNERARRQSVADLIEYAHIATGWGVAVVIGDFLGVFFTLRNAAVIHTFFDFEVFQSSWIEVLSFYWVNVQVALLAQLLVLVVGLIIALMRIAPGPAGTPLRFLAIVYVDIFRAVPSIVVLYLVGFGIAIAGIPLLSDLDGKWLAVIGLSLSYSAYVSEVYRAGLESVHPSQWAAARSLGLSYSDTLRKVIVPQAVRVVIPPLTTDFISLQKDTALLGIIGVIDTFMAARLHAAQVYNLSPVLLTAAIFILVTIPQARLVDYFARRDRRRTGIEVTG